MASPLLIGKYPMWTSNAQSHAAQASDMASGMPNAQTQQPTLGLVAAGDEFSFGCGPQQQQPAVDVAGVKRPWGAIHDGGARQYSAPDAKTAAAPSRPLARRPLAGEEANVSGRQNSSGSGSPSARPPSAFAAGSDRPSAFGALANTISIVIGNNGPAPVAQISPSRSGPFSSNQTSCIEELLGSSMPPEMAARLKKKVKLVQPISETWEAEVLQRSGELQDSDQEGAAPSGGSGGGSGDGGSNGRKTGSGDGSGGAGSGNAAANGTLTAAGVNNDTSSKCGVARGATSLDRPSGFKDYRPPAVNGPAANVTRGGGLVHHGRPTARGSLQPRLFRSQQRSPESSSHNNTAARATVQQQQQQASRLQSGGLELQQQHRHTSGHNHHFHHQQHLQHSLPDRSRSAHGSSSFADNSAALFGSFSGPSAARQGSGPSSGVAGPRALGPHPLQPAGFAPAITAAAASAAAAAAAAGMYGRMPDVAHMPPPSCYSGPGSSIVTAPVGRGIVLQRSGGLEISESDAAGLGQVQGQLGALYQWYIAKRSSYLDQAQQMLQMLESQKRVAAAAAHSDAATYSVLQAFHKAMQIMQASTDVESQLQQPQQPSQMQQPLQQSLLAPFFAAELPYCGHQAAAVLAAPPIVAGPSIAAAAAVN